MVPGVPINLSHRGQLLRHYSSFCGGLSCLVPYSFSTWIHPTCLPWNSFKNVHIYYCIIVSRHIQSSVDHRVQTLCNLFHQYLIWLVSYVVCFVSTCIIQTSYGKAVVKYVLLLFKRQKDLHNDQTHAPCNDSKYLS